MSWDIIRRLDRSVVPSSLMSHNSTNAAPPSTNSLDDIHAFRALPSPRAMKPGSQRQFSPVFGQEMRASRDGPVLVPPPPPPLHMSTGTILVIPRHQIPTRASAARAAPIPCRAGAGHASPLRSAFGGGSGAPSSPSSSHRSPHHYHQQQQRFGSRSPRVGSAPSPSWNSSGGALALHHHQPRPSSPSRGRTALRPGSPAGPISRHDLHQQPRAASPSYMNATQASALKARAPSPFAIPPPILASAPPPTSYHSRPGSPRCGTLVRRAAAAPTTKAAAWCVSTTTTLAQRRRREGPQGQRQVGSGDSFLESLAQGEMSKRRRLLEGEVCVWGGRGKDPSRPWL